MPPNPSHSSGILLFRFRDGRLVVLLVHPGGPFWEKKDENAWSIPKGLQREGENALHAARREFREETGFDADGRFLDLGAVRQPGGKMVHAYALEKDLDEKMVVSNKFSLEWPKKSGIMKEYPEIDRAAWFDAEEAKKKIHKGQVALIDRLVEMLDGETKERGESESLGNRHNLAEMQRPGLQKPSKPSKQFELTDWSNNHDIK